jgi:putative transferase (TIGR04331 family)
LSLVKRFLITTALEETWRDDVPVLFLGEWCRRYSRRQRWEKMDAEVLPYHWDDRAKLCADYKHLQEFYERVLADLAGQLNQIHGVDHGVRYWRILAGPWLGYFIQMLFDRWCCIQSAASEYELSETVVLVGQEGAMVPNAMCDFIDLFLGDEWNQHIYALILRQFTRVPCILRGRQDAIAGANDAPAVGWKQQLKRSVAGGIARLAGILTRDEDVFLLTTYLPALDELKLHLRLRQVPHLSRSEPPIRVGVDGMQRRWSMPGENREEFEACVRSLIPQQIPTAYLEGYDRLVEQTARLSWPNRPKLIWTANSENADDVFKAWAAQKVERGAPLVIGQHGGHYGVGRWSFTEDHQLAISDRYLSWGWSEPGQTKIIPVGQLKSKSPLGIRHAKQPRALLVAAVHPRYSYVMYSTPVASQWINYFADQFAFVEALPKAIQDALIVRLYSQDLGWNQVARWHDRLPSVRLDEGRSNINDLIGQSRLYISTYNATTFLESFTMNVPTVIYWNPKHWELRESAIPYFEELKRVGIFHETPESAARHVAAIWDDVDVWWNSAEVRDVLDRFRKRYCHLPDDLLCHVENALRAVIDRSQMATT